MNRLQEIIASEDGPENPNRHRKGEVIWAKGYKAITTVAKPDLQDFPDDEEMVRYWDIGIKEAQEDLLLVGIKHDETKNREENMWFYYPHKRGSTEEEERADHETHEEQEDSISSSLSLIKYTQQLGSHLHFIAEDIKREDTDIERNTKKSVSRAKLTVNVKGIGEIHKSTVVSLLNSNPKELSSDRFKRVRVGSRQEKTL